LNSLLNGNASDGQPKGEGDTTKEGIKGSEKGNANANRYYGNMGIGSDRNYNLAGRKALLKPKKTARLPGRRRSCCENYG
jgi:hypothetical protein